MGVSSNFSSSVLDLNGVVDLNQPTALAWGPDGRLYLSENGGDVNVLTVKFGDPDPDDGDNTVSFFVESAQTMSLDIQNHDDDGSENSNAARQVTGIDVTKQYDAQGNLIRQTRGADTADAGTWSWTYNGRGQVLTATDALGNTTTYEYEVDVSALSDEQLSALFLVDTSTDSASVEKDRIEAVLREEGIDFEEITE